MLKFIKHHMESIVGIEIYPVISLSIFFIFFTVLIVWVVRTDKGYVAAMSQMPLEEDETEHVQMQKRGEA